MEEYYEPVLRDIQQKCYRISDEHGFHSDDAENAEVEVKNLQITQRLMLVASEITEAFEEHRDGHAPTKVYYNEAKPDKPEGVPIELADAMIRIWDLAETYGIDLPNAIKTKMEYNKSRPYKHGKQF